MPETVGGFWNKDPNAYYSSFSGYDIHAGGGQRHREALGAALVGILGVEGNSSQFDAGRQGAGVERIECGCPAAGGQQGRGQQRGDQSSRRAPRGW